MNFLQDRRVLAALIGGLVLLLALGGLFSLLGHPRQAATDEAPKGGAELKVVMGKTAKVQADTSVRCFVNGRFVGMETAASCAEKNGIAPGALDVGLDQSGAISAGGGNTQLTPLANGAGDGADAGDDADKPDADDQGAQATPRQDGQRPVNPPQSPPQPSPQADAGPRGYGALPSTDCRAYAPGGWRPAGQGVSLDTCVHTLFDGRCPAQGQVIYGYWGTLALRASPGRIEASRGNHNFTPLAPQYPDCSVPPL